MKPNPAIRDRSLPLRDVCLVKTGGRWWMTDHNIVRRSK